MGKFPERRRDDVPVQTSSRHTFRRTRRTHRTAEAATPRRNGFAVRCPPVDHVDESIEARLEQVAPKSFMAPQFNQAALQARVMEQPS
jgi:hypothetical protein